jgi:hypothetical protein
MFPSSKRSKQKIEQSSLSELTPIYGPVIQSAPSWAGPFTMPAVPPTRLVPTKRLNNIMTSYFKISRITL